MSTTATTACSMCHGSGYTVAGTPCSCGSLANRLTTSNKSDQAHLALLRAELAILRAKLEAAEKENSLLQQVETNLTELHNSALATITDQAAQIEALEKDAARYRELCTHMIIPSPSLWDTGVGFYARYIKARAGRISKEELDATLDTAIVEYKGGA